MVEQNELKDALELQILDSTKLADIASSDTSDPVMHVSSDQKSGFFAIANARLQQLCEIFENMWDTLVVLPDNIGHWSTLRYTLSELPVFPPSRQREFLEQHAGITFRPARRSITVWSIRQRR